MRNIFLRYLLVFLLLTAVVVGDGKSSEYVIEECLNFVVSHPDSEQITCQSIWNCVYSRLKENPGSYSGNFEKYFLATLSAKQGLKLVVPDRFYIPKDALPAIFLYTVQEPAVEIIHISDIEYGSSDPNNYMSRERDMYLDTSFSLYLCTIYNSDDHPVCELDDVKNAVDNGGYALMPVCLTGKYHKDILSAGVLPCMTEIRFSDGTVKSLCACFSEDNEICTEEKDYKNICQYSVNPIASMQTAGATEAAAELIGAMVSAETGPYPDTDNPEEKYKYRIDCSNDINYIAIKTVSFDPKTGYWLSILDNIFGNCESLNKEACYANKTWLATTYLIDAYQKNAASLLMSPLTKCTKEMIDVFQGRCSACWDRTLDCYEHIFGRKIVRNLAEQSIRGFAGGFVQEFLPWVSLGVDLTRSVYKGIFESSPQISAEFGARAFYGSMCMGFCNMKSNEDKIASDDAAWMLNNWSDDIKLSKLITGTNQFETKNGKIVYDSKPVEIKVPLVFGPQFLDSEGNLDMEKVSQCPKYLLNLMTVEEKSYEGLKSQGINTIGDNPWDVIISGAAYITCPHNIPEPSSVDNDYHKYKIWEQRKNICSLETYRDNENRCYFSGKIPVGGGMKKSSWTEGWGLGALKNVATFITGTILNSEHTTAFKARIVIPLKLKDIVKEHVFGVVVNCSSPTEEPSIITLSGASKMLYELVIPTAKEVENIEALIMPKTKFIYCKDEELKAEVCNEKIEIKGRVFPPEFLKFWENRESISDFYARFRKTGFVYKKYPIEYYSLKDLTSKESLTITYSTVAECDPQTLLGCKKLKDSQTYTPAAPVIMFSTTEDGNIYPYLRQPYPIKTDSDIIAMEGIVYTDTVYVKIFNPEEMIDLLYESDSKPFDQGRGDECTYIYTGGYVEDARGKLVGAIAGNIVSFALTGGIGKVASEVTSEVSETATMKAGKESAERITKEASETICDKTVKKSVKEAVSSELGEAIGKKRVVEVYKTLTSKTSDDKIKALAKPIYEGISKSKKAAAGDITEEMVESAVKKALGKRGANLKNFDNFLDDVLKEVGKSYGKKLAKKAGQSAISKSISKYASRFRNGFIGKTIAKVSSVATSPTAKKIAGICAKVIKSPYNADRVVGKAINKAVSKALTKSGGIISSKIIKPSILENIGHYIPKGINPTIKELTRRVVYGAGIRFVRNTVRDRVEGFFVKSREDAIDNFAKEYMRKYQSEYTPYNSEVEELFIESLKKEPWKIARAIIKDEITEDIQEATIQKIDSLQKIQLEEELISSKLLKEYIAALDSKSVFREYSNAIIQRLGDGSKDSDIARYARTAALVGILTYAEDAEDPRIDEELLNDILDKFLSELENTLFSEIYDNFIDEIASNIATSIYCSKHTIKEILENENIISRPDYKEIFLSEFGLIKDRTKTTVLESLRNGDIYAQEIEEIAGLILKDFEGEILKAISVTGISPKADINAEKVETANLIKLSLLDTKENYLPSFLNLNLLQGSEASYGIDWTQSVFQYYATLWNIYREKTSEEFSDAISDTVPDDTAAACGEGTEKIYLRCDIDNIEECNEKLRTPDFDEHTQELFDKAIISPAICREGSEKCVGRYRLINKDGTCQPFSHRNLQELYDYLETYTDNRIAFFRHLRDSIIKPFKNAIEKQCDYCNRKIQELKSSVLSRCQILADSSISNSLSSDNNKLLTESPIIGDFLSKDIQDIRKEISEMDYEQAVKLCSQSCSYIDNIPDTVLKKLYENGCPLFTEVGICQTLTKSTESGSEILSIQPGKKSHISPPAVKLCIKHILSLKDSCTLLGMGLFTAKAELKPDSKLPGSKSLNDIEIIEKGSDDPCSVSERLQELIEKIDSYIKIQNILKKSYSIARDIKECIDNSDERDICSCVPATGSLEEIAEWQRKHDVCDKYGTPEPEEIERILEEESSDDIKAAVQDLPLILTQLVIALRGDLSEAHWRLVRNLYLKDNKNHYRIYPDSESEEPLTVNISVWWDILHTPAVKLEKKIPLAFSPYRSDTEILSKACICENKRSGCFSANAYPGISDCQDYIDKDRNGNMYDDNFAGKSEVTVYIREKQEDRYILTAETITDENELEAKGFNMDYDSGCGSISDGAIYPLPQLREKVYNAENYEGRGNGYRGKGDFWVINSKLSEKWKSLVDKVKKEFELENCIYVCGTNTDNPTAPSCAASSENNILPKSISRKYPFRFAEDINNFYINSAYTSYLPMMCDTTVEQEKGMSGEPENLYEAIKNIAALNLEKLSQLFPVPECREYRTTTTLSEDYSEMCAKACKGRKELLYGYCRAIADKDDSIKGMCYCATTSDIIGTPAIAVSETGEVETVECKLPKPEAFYNDIKKCCKERYDCSGFVNFYKGRADGYACLCTSGNIEVEETECTSRDAPELEVRRAYFKINGKIPRDTPAYTDDTVTAMLQIKNTGKSTFRGNINVMIIDDRKILNEKRGVSKILCPDVPECENIATIIFTTEDREKYIELDKRYGKTLSIKLEEFRQDCSLKFSYKFTNMEKGENQISTGSLRINLGKTKKEQNCVFYPLEENYVIQVVFDGSYNACEDDFLSGDAIIVSIFKESYDGKCLQSYDCETAPTDSEIRNRKKAYCSGMDSGISTINLEPGETYTFSSAPITVTSELATRRNKLRISVYATSGDKVYLDRVIDNIYLKLKQGGIYIEDIELKGDIEERFIYAGGKAKGIIRIKNARNKPFKGSMNFLLADNEGNKLVSIGAINIPEIEPGATKEIKTPEFNIDKSFIGKSIKYEISVWTNLGIKIAERKSSQVLETYLVKKPHMDIVDAYFKIPGSVMRTTSTTTCTEIAAYISILNPTPLQFRGKLALSIYYPPLNVLWATYEDRSFTLSAGQQSTTLISTKRLKLPYPGDYVIYLSLISEDDISWYDKIINPSEYPFSTLHVRLSPTICTDPECQDKTDGTECSKGICCNKICIAGKTCSANFECYEIPDETPCSGGICCSGRCINVFRCGDLPDYECNNAPDNKKCSLGVCCSGICRNVDSCSDFDGYECKNMPDNTICAQGSGVCCDEICKKGIERCSDIPDISCMNKPDMTPCKHGICCSFSCENVESCLYLDDYECKNKPDNTICAQGSGVCCNEICRPADRCPAGDGIDNDNDGAIDEDPLDGIDNDGDGLTDEDGAGSDPITPGGDGIDNDNDDSTDEDGAGGSFIDSDGDGVPDNEEEDGCILSADCDSDGLADGEDPDDHNPDSDGDGITDGDEEQGCVLSADCDGDGLADADDPDDHNPDSDGDGITDGTDPDPLDPDIPSEKPIDSDKDGVPDSEEEDGCILLADCDNDGLADADDPNDHNPDSDGDGITDGDEEEGCVLSPDCDGDGLADADDPDDHNPDSDGDGVVDGVDSDPLDPDITINVPGYDDDGDGLIDEDGVGGDGIDNDNDGAIDEDPLDGIDNDNDGLTDEDGAGVDQIAIGPDLECIGKEDGTQCNNGNGICCDMICRNVRHCAELENYPCRGKRDNTPCRYNTGVCCSGLCRTGPSCEYVRKSDRQCKTTPDGYSCEFGICCSGRCLPVTQCDEIPDYECLGQEDGTTCSIGICCNNRCVSAFSCELLPKTSICGDGKCDSGEDCPEDCLYRISSCSGRTGTRAIDFTYCTGEGCISKANRPGACYLKVKCRNCPDDFVPDIGINNEGLCVLRNRDCCDCRIIDG